MKSVLKWIIKCVIAGVLVLAFLAAASPVLADKGIENENYSAIATYRGFYREPQNSLDVLFLGTSNAYCGFSPDELYEQYDLRSYNLSSSQQSLLTSYYWLEEALRTQQPEAVVLETFYCFYTKGNEGSLHKAFDWMNFSHVKIRAVNDLCRSFSDGAEEYNRYDFLIPAFRYHDRWSQLDSSDIHWAKLSKQDHFKGYCPRTERSGREFVTISGEDDAMNRSIPLNDGTKFAGKAAQKLPSFQERYLDKIVSLCRRKGIRLILVKTPSIEWTPAQHDAVTAYAAEASAAGCDVEWIDFNMTDTYQAAGYDFAEDSADTMHANVDGAVKLTDYIGAVLTELS